MFLSFTYFLYQMYLTSVCLLSVSLCVSLNWNYKFPIIPVWLNGSSNFFFYSKIILSSFTHPYVFFLWLSFFPQGSQKVKFLQIYRFILKLLDFAPENSLNISKCHGTLRRTLRIAHIHWLDQAEIYAKYVWNMLFKCEFQKQCLRLWNFLI